MTVAKEYYFNLGQGTFGNSLSQESKFDFVEGQSTQNFPTSGSTGYSSPIINLNISKIVSNLSNEFQNLKDSDQRNLFLHLIQSIHSVLIKYYTQSYEISHLPPLHVVIIEDASILVEWIFTDFRIGFSIEVDISESSWYLLSNDKLGNLTKSGYITSDILDSIINDMVVFIVENT